MHIFKLPPISAAIILAAVVSAMPASAHHSKAMFDDTKCGVLSGTVRNFEWEYPHSWLWIVVPEASGGPQIWASKACRRRSWKRSIIAGPNM